jgi:hypothetical protein
MTPTSSEQEHARAVVAEAMKLPPDIRESVALELLESIEDRPADADAAKTAWREEIARRVEDVKTGSVELVDAKQALAEARQRLRERYGV